MNESSPTEPPVLPKIEYPALYVAASEASRRGKFWHRWMVLTELGLIIVGLFVSVLASVFIPRPTGEHIDHTDLRVNAAAIAIAGSFLLALLVKLIGKTAAFDDDWYAGRAVAEAVRSEAWRYMVKDAPYADRESDRRFADTIRSLLQRTRDIRHAVDRLPERPLQITPSMRAVRSMDLAGRREAYITGRLVDQSRWYARRTASHRRRATLWFWAAIAFQLMATVSAVLALHLVTEITQSEIALRVMSLTGSLALAFTAWTQLNRDEELAKSYAFTVQELSLVTGDAELAQSDRALAAAVQAGEEVIGRENKGWLAKRAEIVESPAFGHSD